MEIFSGGWRPEKRGGFKGGGEGEVVGAKGAAAHGGEGKEGGGGVAVVDEAGDEGGVGDDGDGGGRGELEDELG